MSETNSHLTRQPQKTERTGLIKTWFKNLFSWAVVHKRISALDRRIKSLQSAVAASEADFERRRDELSTLRTDFAALEQRAQDRIKKAETALDISSVTQKKLQSLLEATSEALKIRDEIHIPGLIAADRALTTRWEREAEINALGRASIGMERDEI